MIKKLFLSSLVLTQLMVSCSSDNSSDEIIPEPKPEKELTLEEQIAALLKQPYSNLTPAQQKNKFEAEANEMLVQLDKSKSSGAIEAIKNLGRLFSLKHIDLFDGKSQNGVEEVLNISGVYGIYTWDDAKKTWIKTASTTELKFVFPAKEGQTTNNAVLTSKSTSSNIKFSNVDTYSDWGYNSETGEYGPITPSVQDWFYLPSTVDGLLTINGTEAATFTSNAKYSSQNKSPEDYTYKLTLNDGYTWEMSGKKGVETTSNALFTYNGKNLINFNVTSSAEIDKLIENIELSQYKGKANTLISIMDNFIIIGNTDLTADAADREALFKNNTRPAHPDGLNPNSDFKAYYTALNAYEKKISEGEAASFNKNTKLSLVSKKDGTKIADIVLRSQKAGDDYLVRLPVWNDQGKYWTWSSNGELFAQPYLDEVIYLKFNDNTEAALSVYFSEGFDALRSKFTDFTSAFQTKNK
ncbi:hypothetical protein [Flavobacterium nitrogenifigens]|uniref:Lipoprotein n=1 Tax=Flavobacterium nitrogenifigens TaxID=1617283 RepID=A0A521EZB4_9FLAO|nr:hypothetical protein [Flavobacterium nitrogenifigens]KAF2336073.1 hypothetical protein DM397_05940 [Flavobacterium nitrogenifigens]SMO89352.1 hypothetical protein SAMN06265220_105331 [Flavobacterium nitrogenifigens]